MVEPSGVQFIVMELRGRRETRLILMSGDSTSAPSPRRATRPDRVGVGRSLKRHLTMETQNSRRVMPDFDRVLREWGYIR
jgi:hypothetical protein